MIVFLDFDGVLHPYFSRADRERLNTMAGEFAYLPRVEAVLSEFKHARVVICSDWRVHVCLEDLLTLFSTDFRPFVIGVTPKLPYLGSWTGLRHREAMLYLEQNKCDPEAWVALDDTEENWPIDPRVILCEDGFFDREEQLLRLALGGNC